MVGGGGTVKGCRFYRGAAYTWQWMGHVRRSTYPTSPAMWPVYLVLEFSKEFSFLLDDSVLFLRKFSQILPSFFFFFWKNYNMSLFEFI